MVLASLKLTLSAAFDQKCACLCRAQTDYIGGIGVVLKPCDTNADGAIDLTDTPDPAKWCSLSLFSLFRPWPTKR